MKSDKILLGIITKGYIFVMFGLEWVLVTFLKFLVRLVSLVKFVLMNTFTNFRNDLTTFILITF